MESHGGLDDDVTYVYDDVIYVYDDVTYDDDASCNTLPYVLAPSCNTLPYVLQL